ncbi:MAG TPA: T9SS type A sorting domain-containing protein [Bacteroidales bacterium]|nr:T9SS type A sorting domain-containing protein [Bacteroidales bacterium]
MKKLLLLIIWAIAFSVASIGQNNSPVAVNDTLYGFIGQTYTLNILQNDFDPDGDPIYVYYLRPPLTQINDTTFELTMSEYCFGTMYESSCNVEYLIKDASGLTAKGYVVFILKYPPRYEKIDINNINALISPFGNHFWDGDTSRFEVPKGSGKTAIFNHNLWIGGWDQNGRLCLAGEQFRLDGNDYSPGPVSMVKDTSYVKRWNRVWKISNSEILYHIRNWNSTGYTPIEAIASWPAHGDVSLGQRAKIAPFYDADHDSVYNPMAGDYPLIRGDQAVFFIMNDSMQEHTETLGYKMGVEIHGMAYEFDKPNDSVLKNTLFIHLDIINSSLSDYDSAFIGLYTNFDLGNSQDDFAGTDVTHGVVYAYNGTAVDGNGEPQAYGEHPPAIGLRILGGPFMANDGIDNPEGECNYDINGLNFGDGIIDNERFGLTGSTCVINDPMNYDIYPNASTEYYNCMQNRWSDGTFLNYGGSGNLSTGAVGPECRFIYPGDSDTLCNWGTNGALPNGGYNQNGYYWTEVTSGNTPLDTRMLAISGPFTFEAGQQQPLDYCVTFARDYDGDNLSSVRLLLDNMASITPSVNQLIKLPGIFCSIPDKDRTGKMQVFPNPAHEKVRVVVEGDAGSKYGLYDFSGKLLKEGYLQEGANEIDIRNLKPGVYILKSLGSRAKIIKI